jgi:hypothetical protein
MVKATKKAKRAGETKAVYVNLPFALAQKLAKQAKAESRPMAKLAARIVTEHFDAKRKTGKEADERDAAH